ncbi:MAG: protein kinase [Myxococcota bacterium]|nr:protein kinase [Myxococcota bacterium]
MSVIQDRVGGLIDHRYRVGQPIGRGSMGVVHVGHDEQTDQPIAIKFLEMLDESPLTQRQFLRSAYLASTIRHKYVVKTLDFGRWRDDDFSCYLVMELIRGVPLSAWAKGRLGAGAVIGLMSQVLQALAHMHARNVLHLDIKPDNLLVEHRSDGTLSVKVTDFGLAAAIERTSLIEAETANGQLAGTPLYMAPELMTQAGAPKPRADLYAIGVILYEVLAGSPPFSGTPLEIMLTKTQASPPRLSANLGLDAGIVDIVDRLLVRDPALRFQHAVDVLEALRGFSRVPRASGMAQIQEVVATAPTMAGAGPSELATVVQQTAGAASDHESGQLWGREAVIEAIHAHLSRLDRGGIILLDSDVGMGASAVMKQVTVQLSEQGRCQCLLGDYTRVGGLAFGLRQAIEGFLGTRDLERDDVSAVIAVHLEQYGIDDPGVQAVLVDFMSPRPVQEIDEKRSPNAVFAVVFRLLRAAAHQRPVFLALDELHKDGAAAIAFLQFVKHELAMNPFPLMVCATIAGDHRGVVEPAKWDQVVAGYEDIVIRLRVGPIERTVLAEAIRQNYTLDEEIAYQIADLSGGSPAIATQLAQTCQLNHDLGESFDGERSPVEHARHVLLTPRVADILQRGLDGRLATHPQRIVLMHALEAMSVLGDTVAIDLLSAMLMGCLPDENADAIVRTLVDVGLLVWNVAYEHEVLSLRPALLRTLLLDQVYGDRLVMLHRAGVQAYLSVWGPEHAPVAGAIGDHCAAAGDEEMALSYWQQAFEFERTHGDPIRAVQFGRRVLDAVGEGEAAGAELGLEIASILLDAGLLDEAENYAHRLLINADADDAMCAGEILADCYENRGDADAWRVLLDKLTQRLPETTLRGERAYLRTRSMYANSYGQSRAGLTDALMALDSAPSGLESQRAAQRAVYCCLSMGKPKMGEPYARRALAEAGENSALRVRSLRALGVVLTWLGQSSEAIECHEEVLATCEGKGLYARLPIAYHDLGDTYRLAGQGQLASQMYDIAIHHAKRLDLGHTQQLVRVKQTMCQLTEGETEGVVAELAVLAPAALDSGLGLAVPFCALLEAWAHALNDEIEHCRHALRRAGDVQGYAVDPQLPAIVEAIADIMAEATVTEVAENLYEQARGVWTSQDDDESEARCLAKLDRLRKAPGEDG